MNSQVDGLLKALNKLQKIELLLSSSPVKDWDKQTGLEIVTMCLQEMPDIHEIAQMGDSIAMISKVNGFLMSESNKIAETVHDLQEQQPGPVSAAAPELVARRLDNVRILVINKFGEKILDLYGDDNLERIGYSWLFAPMLLNAALLERKDYPTVEQRPPEAVYRSFHCTSRLAPGSEEKLFDLVNSVWMEQFADDESIEFDDLSLSGELPSDVLKAFLIRFPGSVLADYGIVDDGSTIVGDDNTIVGDDNTIVDNDNTIVDDDSENVDDGSNSADEDDNDSILEEPLFPLELPADKSDPNRVFGDVCSELLDLDTFLNRIVPKADKEFQGELWKLQEQLAALAKAFLDQNVGF